ncbi:MAG: M67 family metallopeptidase [Chloroflexota bacterium]|nr:M67 family metallopeptidase [Chloroflexota bacterium]
MTFSIPQRQDAGISLSMNASLFDAIVKHLAAALPNEGVCLVATVATGEAERATAFFPGTNLDHSPTRYTMDPAEVMAAFRVIGANGWRLGAIAHSHASSGPTPSATDLQEAFYPDAFMLIVGFINGVAAARLWRTPLDRTANGVREARLVIEDA